MVVLLSTLVGLVVSTCICPPQSRWICVGGGLAESLVVGGEHPFLDYAPTPPAFGVLHTLVGFGVFHPLIHLSGML
jgi:hypothetical protein